MKLIFKGVVQGVGFRPIVYRVATQLGLHGYVLNTGSEVEVVINRDVEDFLCRLKKELPNVAEISEVERRPDHRRFADFRILPSTKGEKKSLIPPDVCLCDDCREEMFDKKNRRYLFPFTNCTVCGARFSLIADVPYDRERTSMKPFVLCKECRQEYTTVEDRRYHAQTISCPACGPSYSLYDGTRKDFGAGQAIERFAQKIDDGAIGVIKSWGGMHLCCTLEQLPRFRTWYRRPQKAFALMVKDLTTARRYAAISSEEECLLTSSARPIVLLKKKTAELVSPGLDTIGLYLPYTGLHHLLFSFLSAQALVMTSANIPGEPMLLRNDDVFALQAEYYLLHNRQIPNRTDDSVVRLWNGHRFFLRKSRGFVPEALPVEYPFRIMSVGAGENVTGALSVDKKLYSTQYIGNTKYYEAVQFLYESLQHLKTLFLSQGSLDAVAMDTHPGYETRQVAQRIADEDAAPVIEVDHHWAHAASLLADHQVSRCIVLTLDGLGYGTDGRIWGGEVLDTGLTTYTRVGHLEYFPLLGGDQATRDPRRLVFALFHRFGKDLFFTGEDAGVLSKLMSSAPLCCSLGRYLDALSCYLGICTQRTYSGEPAMKLEKYLAMGMSRHSFDVRVTDNVVGVIDVFRQLGESIKFPLSEKKKADVAYSFVKVVVDALTDIAVHRAQEAQVKLIGITGGVSYNVPIVEMVQTRVHDAGLSFLVHDKVPNGDGGIAVGQNLIAGNQLKK
ncbi:MAG: carbamoyltransferase HypF [Candidatus Thermoplasmatota archaeon]|nr:carbamoyltransferase HypF [Candidatus Thermoplasmatota archaeon]